MKWIILCLISIEISFAMNSEDEKQRIDPPERPQSPSVSTSLYNTLTEIDLDAEELEMVSAAPLSPSQTEALANTDLREIESWIATIKRLILENKPICCLTLASGLGWASSYIGIDGHIAFENACPNSEYTLFCEQHHHVLSLIALSITLTNTTYTTGLDIKRLGEKTFVYFRTNFITDRIRKYEIGILLGLNLLSLGSTITNSAISLPPRYDIPEGTSEQEETMIKAARARELGILVLSFLKSTAVFCYFGGQRCLRYLRDR